VPDRTGKGAATRERILATAATLFHQRGINATSLGEVLRASGAGKGQFYQHFSSRDDLVESVLERHASFFRSAPEIASWDELRDWMDGYVGRQAEAHYLVGCPVGTAAYALQADQDRPRETIGTIFGGMRDTLAAFFRSERRAGRLAPDADPRRLAEFTIAAVQGAMILGLVERGPSAARRVVDEAYAHLTSHIRDPQEAAERRA
jgi:TetR/AcrR family transcriptional regulator, transcriptional repressor for nem operon